MIRYLKGLGIIVMILAIYATIASAKRNYSLYEQTEKRIQAGFTFYDMNCKNGCNTPTPEMINLVAVASGKAMSEDERSKLLSTLESDMKTPATFNACLANCQNEVQAKRFIVQAHLPLKFDSGYCRIVERIYCWLGRFCPSSAIMALAPDADAGDQYNLGVVYDEGKGAPQDHGKAVEWYRKAAEQGMVEAQYNLGHAYWKGDGVQEDFGKAVEWFKMAAEQGCDRAQYLLGAAYGDGKGVQQDVVLAYAWFDLAAKQGMRAAKKDRDIAQELLSPSDLSEAKALVLNWKLGKQLKRATK